MMNSDGCYQCFWLTRTWGQSAHSTEFVPEEMRAVGGERFLQMTPVSTAHNGVGDALGRALCGRRGCVWCQLEKEFLRWSCWTFYKLLSFGLAGPVCITSL